MRTVAFYTIGIGVCAILLWTFSTIQKWETPATSRTRTQQEGAGIQQYTLWTLVQDWRTQQGLTPYKEHPGLCLYASKRLKQVRTDFNHGTFANSWKQSPHMAPFWHAAENLARNYHNEQDTLTAWIASPNHKKNLVGEYEYSCIATDGSHVVHLFAK